MVWAGCIGLDGAGQVSDREGWSLGALAKQNITCGENQALRNFQLVRPEGRSKGGYDRNVDDDWRISYQYSCCSLNSTGSNDNFKLEWRMTDDMPIFRNHSAWCHSLYSLHSLTINCSAGVLKGFEAVVDNADRCVLVFMLACTVSHKDAHAPCKLHQCISILGLGLLPMRAHNLFLPCTTGEPLTTCKNTQTGC